MGNKEKSIVRKIWNKIKFEWDMWRKDFIWKFWNNHRRQLYPPSFYYRHTPEEAERIIEEDITYLQDRIDKYETRENTTDPK